MAHEPHAAKFAPQEDTAGPSPAASPQGSLRIAICTTQVPFVYGGNEVLVEGLRDALVERGHRVSIISIPYRWHPRKHIVTGALAWRLIDITESNGEPVDLAICTKWPSYVVKHPRKVVWLVHQFRQAYDWFGTPLSDFTSMPEDRRVRRLILKMDHTALSESRGVFTISENVANRLRRFNGLEGTPLYPPLRSGLSLEPGPYGDYVFSLNRLDPAKRIGLLLEALAQAPEVRAVIAGTGPEADNLKRQATRLGVANRVEFAGFVSDEEASRLYRSAGAVYYAPVDEDYGYGTIEAFQAARPVITTSDAGGVLEFVEHGVTGLVSPPEPAAIARSLQRVVSNREEAEMMGRAGRERVRDITWDRVVEALLGAAG
ncbi:MAG TPA: glycosyltransferase family 4 protein [Chloroflexia bacterium]|nr:glycosyltransferase family 4 protein [Chloroflexia bacterium]